MKRQETPKEILRELCRQQIMMQSHYNRFASCCRGIPLRNQVLDVLREEHLLHGELLNQLLEQGLCQYDIATREQVEQIKKELKQRGIE